MRSSLCRGMGSAALLAVVVAASVPADTYAGGDHAAPAKAAALDRIRALAGEWEGTNSKGDPVRMVFEVIGDGSSVMERLIMKGEHPHDMLTLYHMDGDRLMLTHYCAAGNQPRMHLASQSDREARFEFLDATGLASPDAGHMRRAVVTFEGPDRISSAWTWFEGGKEQFTEVIRVKRAADRAAR